MTGGPKGVSPPHARIEVDMACIHLAVCETKEHCAPGLVYDSVRTPGWKVVSSVRRWYLPLCRLDLLLA